jgi:Inhibitor of vertebrate lysozyme (Ivy)
MSATGWDSIVKHFAMLLMFLVSFSAAGAADLPYLSERLSRNPTYNKTLLNLLKGKSITPWLREYLANYNGVDTPGKLISVGKKPYEIYQVCEPHNCPGNFIYVLYDVGGERAVALLTIEDRDFRLFGNPNASEKDALFAASTGRWWN